MDGILLLLSALLTSACLVAWAWLVLARGQFWRTDQRLPPTPPPSADNQLSVGSTAQWPGFRVVVPARNEAQVLPRTLPTLLGQDYPGRFHITLVDDRSEDGTAEVARRVALDEDAVQRLTVVAGEPPPPGWTGKLWAVQQGLGAGQPAGAEFVMLTDADIAHPPESLRALVQKAESARLDLVSLMARLRVETVWDRLLIPAFVFFFAKLYPFRWANDPRESAAAAAGGCMLVRGEALARSGGLEPIADRLIDDCALAELIKRRGRPEGGRIWLGLSQDVRSLRIYGGLRPIWSTVARTAFAQLNYSAMLLVGTVLGMVSLYLVPVLGALGGLVAVATGPSVLGIWLASAGVATWALMAASYIPMLRWHSTSPLFAPLLPLTAILYTMMTVNSALRFWRGEGGRWKGRTYGMPGPSSAQGECYDR